MTLLSRTLGMLFFLIFSGTTIAGELDISPEKPTAGSRLNFIYKADELLKSNPEINLFAYVYISNNPEAKAYQISLSKTSGDNYSGTFVLPEKSVFLLFKIDGRDEYFDVGDNNKGRMWDLIVYDSKSTPVEEAHLRCAQSYLGAVPENMKRLIDYTGALQKLREEVTLYPDNELAKIARASLMYDLRKLTYDDFEKTVTNLADSDFDKSDKELLQALIRGLRTINKESKAEDLQEDYSKKFEKEKLKAVIDYENVTKAGSRIEFNEKAVQFLKEHEKSEYRKKVFDAWAGIYLKSGELKELVLELDKIGNIKPELYADLAVKIVSSEDIPDNMSVVEKVQEAKSIYNFKIKHILDDDNYFENEKTKPSYLTNSEWAADRLVARANLAVMSAKIFEKAEMPKANLELLEKAKNWLGFRAGTSFYETLIEACLMADNDRKAYDYSVEAIENSADSPRISEVFQRGFKRYVKGSDDDMNDYLAKLGEKAYNKRLDETMSEMIEIKDINGIFITPDGRMLDFDDLKGRYTVITFWATWCEPCDLIFPSLENLFSRYENNPDIAIIGIDIWEKSDDRAELIFNHLEKNPYKIPLFYDQFDYLPTKLGISGLPTTVILDENADVRFIINGFTNEIDFVTKVEDRLRILSNEK